MLCFPPFNVLYFGLDHDHDRYHQQYHLLLILNLVHKVCGKAMEKTSKVNLIMSKMILPSLLKFKESHPKFQ